MGNNEFLEPYERADLITAENRDEPGQTERPTKIEGNSEELAAPTGEGPRYYKSRTPDEWRAYHREYYRMHADRRRQQKKASHQRMALVCGHARYGGIVPKRIIRMLFLR